MNESHSTRQALGANVAATLAVAATYFYFLLFAEFAFLELVQAERSVGQGLRLLMGLLGAGGVAGSLFAAWSFREERYAQRLAVWFLTAGAAAAAAVMASSPWQLLLVAVAAGFSLGALTVTLATGLRRRVGTRHLGLCVGVGTGVAYATCNLPWVFNASPAVQTLIAAVAMCLGATSTLGLSWESRELPSPEINNRTDGVRWIVVLLGLVWPDSAAFYIIQHTPYLRLAMWAGTGTLLSNAGVHLAAAVLAGCALDRGARVAVVLPAFGFLAAACFSLKGGAQGVVPAEALYTLGVSLYSVVLVYVPARDGRAWFAGLVFAVAGWIGSALGIGMAQDLAHVPTSFVVGAGLVMGLVIFGRRRGRPALRGGLATLLAYILILPAAKAGEDPLILRGREVYVAEGCIHCHSQFIRPRTDDVVRWGPADPLETVLRAEPPLLGNRRQGPDLSHVGGRRTEEWNRLHLKQPRAISPGSRMPSYAHLFRSGDKRGDALVAYLATLGAEVVPDRQAVAQAWAPLPAVQPAPRADRLFAQLCAPCHGPDGHGDGPVAPQLSVRPVDFRRDAWRYARGDDEILALARIIKFGLPGLPMAGHEYLRDSEVLALALHVRSLHARDVATAPP